MIAAGDWEEIGEGTAITPLSLPIAYEMVAGVIFAARDWFPGHHEPAYAAGQGKADIYLNTVFLQGFIDRVALRWAGPAWFVQRRRLRMLESVYPGDMLVGSGIVTSKARLDSGMLTIAIDIEGRTDRARAFAGAATVALPWRTQGMGPAAGNMERERA